MRNECTSYTRAHIQTIASHHLSDEHIAGRGSQGRSELEKGLVAAVAVQIPAVPAGNGSGGDDDGDTSEELIGLDWDPRPRRLIK